MIGILIIAHGSMSQSLAECATHVMGEEPKQFAYYAVNSQDDPEKVVTKMQQTIAKLNTGRGVLILSDMYGATPCNIVTKLLKPGEIEGVAGVNLPMLIRALNFREAELLDLVVKVVMSGREGIVQFGTEEHLHA